MACELSASDVFAVLVAEGDDGRLFTGRSTTFAVGTKEIDGRPWMVSVAVSDGNVPDDDADSRPIAVTDRPAPHKTASTAPNANATTTANSTHWRHVCCQVRSATTPTAARPVDRSFLYRPRPHRPLHVHPSLSDIVAQGAGLPPSGCRHDHDQPPHRSLASRGPMRRHDGHRNASPIQGAAEFWQGLRYDDWSGLCELCLQALVGGFLRAYGERRGRFPERTRHAQSSDQEECR